MACLQQFHSSERIDWTMESRHPLSVRRCLRNEVIGELGMAVRQRSTRGAKLGSWTHETPRFD